MSKYPHIVLRPGKEESLKRFHPWIFSGAIEPQLSPKGLEEGEIVSVYSSSGAFLAVGQLQIGSIAIRVLSFKNICIDRDFYFKRLKCAFELRKSLQLIRNDNNIYRLVHGEGDNLSGLVIDIYGDTAVIQAHTVGMHLHRHIIAQALQDIFETEAKSNKNTPLLNNIYYKSETTLPYKADIEKTNEYLLSNATSSETNLNNTTKENGHIFLPNWLNGQKTGFFIDQRDNRSLVGKHSKNRSVLNMFCYTGGFSIYALKAEAKRVDSVDSSTKAIDLTNTQVEANFKDSIIAQRHRAITDDAFSFMEKMKKDEYDLIILDPPAFAKRRDVLQQALQGYRKINAKAIEKIAPGGLLFTFSCSQAVSKDHFRQAVFSAAASTGRKLRILQQLSQCSDHPINIYHPEGEYLKGLMLYVE